ncbi:MAG: hypothetical protein QOH39_1633 [Verrucomicrobiota bacterium]
MVKRVVLELVKATLGSREPVARARKAVDNIPGSTKAEELRVLAKPVINRRALARSKEQRSKAPGLRVRAEPVAVKVGVKAKRDRVEPPEHKAEPKVRGRAQPLAAARGEANINRAPNNNNNYRAAVKPPVADRQLARDPVRDEADINKVGNNSNKHRQADKLRALDNQLVLAGPVRDEADKSKVANSSSKCKAADNRQPVPARDGDADSSKPNNNNHKVRLREVKGGVDSRCSNNSKFNRDHKAAVVEEPDEAQVEVEVGAAVAADRDPRRPLIKGWI